MYVEITKLAEADRPAWERLFVGYNAFYKRVLPQPVIDQAWDELQADTRIHALAAKADGRLVGIAHFLVHANVISADVCYMQDLFTDEQARGRGVGRALIEAVAGWARERGCAKLYWQTHETNATARRLYDQVANNDGFIVYRMALS